MKPFTRGATKAMRALWNFPIRAMNKGVHINSPHVIGEKLADGRMRLHLAQLTTSGTTASPSLCPGTLATYCLDIGEGNIVTLSLIDACHWRGTFGSGDLLQQFDLGITEDVPQQWYLSLDNGDVIALKDWEDGNPEGAYISGEGLLGTVGECE